MRAFERVRGTSWQFVYPILRRRLAFVNAGDRGVGLITGLDCMAPYDDVTPKGSSRKIALARGGM
jgi:hypothetical protein